MGLQDFERRLERVVEGVFAKTFRSGLQPVEIGRRLTREMDLRRSVGVHGIIVPNVFGILISPTDEERFESFMDALIRELEEAARAHARQEGYVFVGPVRVDIEVSPRQPTGTVEVLSEIRGTDTSLPYAALVLPDGERVPIGAEPMIIGRLPDCTVVLADSNVSRRHAQLRWDGSYVVIEDLGSTNGTRVNRQAIVTQRLQDGDEISVGSTTLYFEAY
ncbi:MAG: DUF3662 domain-containing protein [Actinobacteria bacterium]|nr:DUF3662 domain-containing protein [Actinomycetota bacterium]